MKITLLLTTLKKFLKCQEQYKALYMHISHLSILISLFLFLLLFFTQRRKLETMNVMLFAKVLEVERTSWESILDICNPKVCGLDWVKMQWLQLSISKCLVAIHSFLKCCDWNKINWIFKNIYLIFPTLLHLYKYAIWLLQ